MQLYYNHVICFRKFEHFRKLIIVDISVLLKLTVNTDAVRTLPPPKKFATDLEIYSIRCIKEWNDEFGKDFKDEFNFVLKYLSKYKKVGYQCYYDIIAIKYKCTILIAYILYIRRLFHYTIVY